MFGRQTQHSALSTQHCRWRSGFTLVELVMSMAVMTIVMGGMASAIFLASRGVDADSPVAGVVESGRMAEQMAGELACAVGFTEWSATVVEFQVPDRGVDGVPETIRYAWSGTAGDPLTRQYNGGTIVEIVEDVQEFVLSYETIATAWEEGEPTENESAETLLFSFDATAHVTNFKIKEDEWPGEFFQPSLPGDAISWKVTRLKFLAKLSGPGNGLTLVQLRLPEAGDLPGGTVLEEHTMYESSLSTMYAWQEFSFDSVSGLAPGEGLCLVLQHVNDAEAAKIRYQNEGASTPNAAMLQTDNAGSSWTASTDQALDLYVWGTVTALGEPDPLPTTYRVGAVNIRLRTGPEASLCVETAVGILNAPELAAP